MTLDLASLASVRQFVQDFQTREHPPLEAIVCNAGVQIVSGTRYTENGFEITFGVNHLEHFLLVNLLLPQLSDRSRIVFVSSDTHNPETNTGIPGSALARLILDPALLMVTGRYFDGLKEIRSSDESYDEQKAVELWETSVGLTH